MPTGYACKTCGKWHDIGAVFMQQTVGELRVQCDQCFARYSIMRGHVIQTRRGKVLKRGKP